MNYKVFRQLPDHSFLEIAGTMDISDANSVLANYGSGMITRNGIIVSTKNLKSEDTPELPIDYAAQP